MVSNFLYSSLKLSASNQASFFFCFDSLLLVLADFFTGQSGAANQAIEANREGRRAEGEEIAANAPRTLREQLLSIQDHLRLTHRMLRHLQRVGAQAIAALWLDMPVPRTPSRTAD